MSLYTPDQYADLVISEVEKDYHAKTGEFLHFGKYRSVLIKHFYMAISSAFEQAIATAQAAASAGIEELEPHLRKHIPTQNNVRVE